MITPYQPSERTPQVSARRKRRLGDLLIEAKLISPNQLADALIHQQNHGGRLGSSLVTLGFLTEQALESNLAK